MNTKGSEGGNNMDRARKMEEDAVKMVLNARKRLAEARKMEGRAKRERERIQERLREMKEKMMGCSLTVNSLEDMEIVSRFNREYGWRGDLHLATNDAAVEKLAEEIEKS